MPAGRPTPTLEEKKEIIAKVCDLAIEKPIHEACEELGIGYTTFYKWLQLDKEFMNMYARAREAISYTVEAKLEKVIADVQREGGIKPDAARVVIDAEKWLAGKRNNSVYGDKKDVTSGGEPVKPFQIVVEKEEHKEMLENL